MILEIEVEETMQIDFLEPVLNKNGEPCWLVRKTDFVSDSNLNKTMKDIIKENKPLKEKSTFNLRPMGLWRCLKCGAEALSNDKEPIACSECDFKNIHFERVTEIVNPDLWKFPKWKDIPDFDMKQTYYDIINLIKKCLIFVDDIQYKIFTLWIISTWKIESWESVGFLIFIGLIDSGKSKALDILKELSWRMINAGSGVTFPAMVRSTHFYGAGILLDEIHDKLTNKTEKGQDLIDFLKPSNRRGSKYIVADKENPKKILSYNNFGFKAFAGEHIFDRAIISRSIIFEMEQDYPEIQKIKQVQDMYDNLQTKLLNYRYKTGDPPDLPPDFQLKGRILEIFESIIRTGMHIGIDVEDVIQHAKKIKQDEVDSLNNTVEWIILNIIKNEECNEKLFDAPEEISYYDILSKMNWEQNRKNAQRLGYIFNKKLNLKTKRKNTGTFLMLNEPKNKRRLKYLFKRYGL
jgi:DNA-directed RNA polymerase subunit RPC12/RpoP